MNRLIYLIPLILFLFMFHFASIEGVYMMDFDSQQFKHAAETWKERGVLEETNGGSFVHWPPLYPIILSSFTDNLAKGAKIFHFICLGLSLVLWTSIYKKFITDSYLLWGLVLLNAVSLPFIYLGHFLWVESLFVFLLSCSIYECLFWKGWKSVILMTCCGVLLALLRTASVLFFINFFLIILALYRDKFFFHKSLSLVISFIVWLGYRLFVSGRGSIGRFVTFNLDVLYQQIEEHFMWYLGFFRECFLPFIPYDFFFEMMFITLFITWFFLENRRHKLPTEVLFIGGIVLLYLLELPVITIIKGFGNPSEVFRHLAVVSTGIYFIPIFLLQRIKVKPVSNRRYLYILVASWVLLNFIRSSHQIACWNNWL